jgi:uncharacterized protein (TIGR02231 family)
MKSFLALLTPALLGATSLALAAEGDPVAVSSVIERVTVYSDRARVTRAAAVEVEAKPRSYAFEKLPGWVDDGSVRVAVSQGRITDVQVRRDYLARATDQEYLDALAQVEELQHKIGSLQDEITVLDAQKKQIEGMKAFAIDKMPKDTAIRDVPVKSYKDVLDFVSASLRETAKARREVDRGLTRLKPELAAKQRRLAEIQSLTQLEQTTVIVTVEHTGSGRASLELTYMLPGATWEPAHDLRVAGASPRAVEVVSSAVVTQTSGEDWDHAEISFSTQSSTDAIRIPDLEALRLGDTPTPTRVIATQEETFNRAAQAYQGQNELWNKVHRKHTVIKDFEQIYTSNVQRMQVVQSRTVEIFTALQRRGTTALFKGQERTPVRGDGHPVRLPIGRAALEAVQRIVAAPEDSLNAARTLDMTNAGGQALLPGQVALYQDGAFLGMTEIGFVADGEKFSLFLSVADQVKLARTLDKQHSSLLRKKTHVMQLAFLVSVENLSGAPVTLELADRVPVSQNKEIEIDDVEIDPPATPDSRGLLRWTVALGPKEKRTYRISYRVEYPPTLVLQTEHSEPAEPSASPSAGQQMGNESVLPPSPRRQRKLGIEEQIDFYKHEL